MESSDIRMEGASRKRQPGEALIGIRGVGWWWVWIIVVVLGGCGRSAEDRLRHAREVLDDGDAEQAVALAQSVLDEQPDQTGAMMLIVRARLQQDDFDASRQTLNGLISAHADNTEARHLFLDWAIRRVENLLDRPALADDSALREQVEQVFTDAAVHASWLEKHEPKSHRAAMQLASLDEWHARWLKLKISYLQQQSKDIRVKPFQLRQITEELTRTRQARVTRMEQVFAHLRRAIELSPGSFDAWQRYAQLLIHEQQWVPLWDLAGRLGKLKDLPLDTAETFVRGLLLMPDHEQPRHQRIDLGVRILDAVPPHQQDQVSWKVWRVKLFHANGQWNKASSLVMELIRQDPRSPQARLLNAQSLYHRGEFDLAMEVVEKLVREPRHDPQANFIYALLLVRRGSTALAGRELQTLIEQQPDNVRAHEILIELLARQGQTSQAEELLQNLLQTRKHDALSVRTALHYYRARGWLTKVKALMEQTATAVDLNAGQLENLVEGYLYLRDADKASTYAKQLATRRPDLVEAQVMPVVVEIAAGHPDSATRQLSPLLEQADGHTDLDRWISRLALDQQRYRVAKEHLTLLLRRQPDDVDARLNLAEALLALGEDDPAMRQIRWVLGRLPTHTRAHTLAAAHFLLNDATDQAFSHLSQINPAGLTEMTDPVLFVLFRLNQANPTEALNIGVHAQLAGHDSPLLRQVLAKIHETRDELDKAESQLIEAVHLYPNAPQLFSMLRDLFLRSGQANHGLVVLNALRETNPFLVDLADAQLLSAVGRHRDARQLLEPGFHHAIELHDPVALDMADALAAAYMATSEPGAAEATYQAMIDAGFLPWVASLRRLDAIAATLDQDMIIERLVTLGHQLPATQTPVRARILKRLQSLGAFEQVLNLVNAWATDPPEVELLMTKGHALIQIGHLPRAIEVYRKILQDHPHHLHARLQLAQAYQTAFDFKHAEDVLRQLDGADESSKRTLQLELTRMFHRLGLSRQANAVIDSMEMSGRWPDPVETLKVGHLLAKLQNDYLATRLLTQIAPTAPQYPSAQILLARIEQHNADTTAARERLHSLLRNELTHNPAVRSLLALDRRDPTVAEMLDWANEVVDVTRLDRAEQLQWMRVRVKLHEQLKHWQSVAELYDRMATLAPEALDIPQGLVILHLRQRHLSRAKSLFFSREDVMRSDLGSLLAAVLKLPDDATPSTATDPLTAYLTAMIRGDLETARQAAQRVPINPYFMRSDLVASTKPESALSPDKIDGYRVLGMAQVATRIGLHGFARDLAQEVINRQPVLVPAYAMLAAASDRAGQPMDDVERQATQRIPTATVSAVLRADRDQREMNFDAAVNDMKQAIRREPDNPLLRLHDAHLLHDADRPKQADTVIRELWQALENDPSVPGEYRVAAAVARVTILLSGAKPTMAQIEQASHIVKQGLALDPDHPRLLDWAGWIAHLRGDDAQALTSLNHAVIESPTDPAIHNHLGAVYQSLGNNQWARYHLDQAAHAYSTEPAIRDAQQRLETLEP